MPTPVVLAALRAGFEDPDAEVNAACLRSLGAHLEDAAADEAELLRRCREALLSREPALRRVALGLLLAGLGRQERRGQALDRGTLRVVLAGLGTGDIDATELPALAALARAEPSQLLRRALVVGLRGSAWQLRPACAHGLGRQRHHAEAAAALRQGLSDPEPQVRAACAEALDEGAAPWDGETQRDLIAALSDPHPLVRVAVARTLGRAAADAAVRGALLRGAADVSGRARHACLEALVPYAAEPAVQERLALGRSDPYWPVADLCASCLGQPAPPRPPLPERPRAQVPAFPRPLPGAPLATGELALGLRHDDPDVRLYCAAALAAHGEEAARRALCATLVGRGETELYELLPAWMLAPPSGHGRAACALGLAMVTDDTAARRALLDGLKDGHGEVREACARSLAGAAGRSEVQEALRSLFREGRDSEEEADGRAAGAAADALGGQAQRADVRALLLDGLSAPGAELRAACAGALGGALPEPQVEAALLRMLGDPVVAVRRRSAAAFALSRPALRRQREALLLGLRGGDSALREGCARALAGLAAEVPDVAGELATIAASPTGALAAALRLSLVRSLGEALTMPVAAAVLQERLAIDGDAQVRACCAELLAPRAGEPGPRAALRAALTDSNRFVQRACARALGPADETAQAHLLAQLAERAASEEVRAGAAMDLAGAAADPDVQAALLRHLAQDPSAAVRRACAEALGST